VALKKANRHPKKRKEAIILLSVESGEEKKEANE
jgi:hypothetical protein